MSLTIRPLQSAASSAALSPHFFYRKEEKRAAFALWAEHVATITSRE
ncbi:MAG: hypothetical protein QOH67_2857 [Hyphomicrobiales bacterium]|nr:hypothetical protein [Hyphomicrobiales bacterium]